MPVRSRSALVAAVVAVGLGACASTGDSKNAIAVTSTDSKCTVATTKLPAGPSTFRVTNRGRDVTEVYVYTKSGDVKGEVENIGPGTARNLNVNLTAGSYEVACKPGQKGDGIRTPITVTGSGGHAALDPTESESVTATDYEFAGIAGTTFTTGEAVEFRLYNDAPAEEHELEVFGPNGLSPSQAARTQISAASSRATSWVPVPVRTSRPAALDPTISTDSFGIRAAPARNASAPSSSSSFSLIRATTNEPGGASTRAT